MFIFEPTCATKSGRNDARLVIHRRQSQFSVSVQYYTQVAFEPANHTDISKLILKLVSLGFGLPPSTLC